MLRLKDVWETDNTDLVTPGQRISEIGLRKYWDAIEATFKFNMQKRTEFLAREAAKSIQKLKRGMRNTDDHDPMLAIFQRRQEEDNRHDHHGRHHRHDRYHWARDSVGDRRQNRGDRFILPRP